MAKLAQQMPTVDPAVLESLQKSKAAMETAMAADAEEYSGIRRGFEAANSEDSGTATAAMASQLEAVKAASRPVLERMDENNQGKSWEPK